MPSGLHSLYCNEQNFGYEAWKAQSAVIHVLQGLRGSIPPNFPYFFVEFGLSTGFVHVIDNEGKFDKDFGRSIMAGLLGLGAESQHRGAGREPLTVQKQLLSDFVTKFDPYDWTKQLQWCLSLVHILYSSLNHACLHIWGYSCTLQHWIAAVRCNCYWLIDMILEVEIISLLLRGLHAFLLRFLDALTRGPWCFDKGRSNPKMHSLCIG